MGKHASIFEKDGTLCCVADYRTRGGLLFTSDTLLTLPVDAAPEHKGASLRRMLTASRLVARLPDDRSRVDPVVQAVGFSNHYDFYRGARLVTAEREKGRIVLAPWRNRGVSFEPLHARAELILERPSDCELGTALEKALDRTR